MNETSISLLLAQALTPTSTLSTSPIPTPASAPTPTQAQPQGNQTGLQVNWSIDAGDILNFFAVLIAAFITFWAARSAQNQIRQRRAKLIDDWRNLIENPELSILDLSDKLKNSGLEKHLLESSIIVINEQVKTVKNIISNDFLIPYIEHPDKEKFRQYLAYEVAKNNKEREFRNEIEKELNRLEKKWRLI